MKAKILVYALSVLFLTTIHLAEAQQAGKIFRIGFLDGSTASGTAGLLDAFRQELNKLGWIDEKISPLSIGLASKKISVYLGSRQTWLVLTLI